MTLQEIFNKSALHLLTQNKVSERMNFMHEKIGCAYRGGGGLMCAIGCLIPDHLYDRNMDLLPDSSIEGILENYEFVEVFGFVNTDLQTLHLMNNLQNIHDNTEPNEWAKHLVFVGKKFKLDTSVVENFNKGNENV